MEPRAAAPSTRIRLIEKLSAAGIPTGVLASPMIPALNDHELENILSASADAGAKRAGYLMVRLPHEVAPLFRTWLETHYPLKAQHVMSRIQAMRGGNDNDPRFGTRMTGEGEFASLMKQRFRVATTRLGLNQTPSPSLDCSQFRAPSPLGQLALF